MPRLIDANMIPWEEYYVPDPDSNVQWDYKKELSVLKPVVDQMPTVDAVEVVRCEKCVHCVNDEEEPGMCKCVESAEYDSESGLWLGFVEYHTPDFFCAYGEMKDNDNRTEL